MNFIGVAAVVVLLAVVPLAAPLKCAQCDSPMSGPVDCKTTFPEPKDCPQMNTYCFQNMTYTSKDELAQVRRGCTNDAAPSEACHSLPGGGKRCDYTCNTDGCNPAIGFAITNEPSRLVILIVSFSVMLTFILHK